MELKLKYVYLNVKMVNTVTILQEYVIKNVQIIIMALIKVVFFTVLIHTLLAISKIYAF